MAGIMTGILQDLRYAARAIWRARVFPALGDMPGKRLVSDKCRERLWLLKNSLPGNLQKSDRVRKLYKQFPRVA